jgi:hypothetical protein
MATIVPLRGKFGNITTFFAHLQELAQQGKITGFVGMVTDEKGDVKPFAFNVLRRDVAYGALQLQQIALNDDGDDVDSPPRPVG